MNFLIEQLEELSELGLVRSLRRHNDSPGRWIELDGRSVINFSSNNYLGLASHPKLIAAAKDVLHQGTGSTASRLVTGNLALHERLESELAKFHEVEAVRIYNSGYQANIGLISAIAQSGDLILSDSANHASMIDGCRLSRATVRIYDHCDMDSLLQHFVSCQNEEFERVFVLTEGVFSMDGNNAPLKRIRDLCNKFQALLIVDDVHSLGVIGPAGTGLCASLEVVPDALIGGLGKAFGSFGGYVAGSRHLCRFLLHRSRSFVFSTGLPPAVVAASLAGLNVIQSDDGESRRQQLAVNINHLRAGLQSLDLLHSNCGNSPIFPIVIGDPNDALQAMSFLLDNGVFCQAIRPPTVAIGSSRLRVSLSSYHQHDDIELLLQLLRDLPRYA